MCPIFTGNPTGSQPAESAKTPHLPTPQPPSGLARARAREQPSHYPPRVTLVPPTAQLDPLADLPSGKSDPEHPSYDDRALRHKSVPDLYEMLRDRALIRAAEARVPDSDLPESERIRRLEEVHDVVVELLKRLDAV